MTYVLYYFRLELYTLLVVNKLYTKILVYYLCTQFYSMCCKYNRLS